VLHESSPLPLNIAQTIICILTSYCWSLFDDAQLANACFMQYTAKQPTSAQQPSTQPQTVREFQWQRYWATNPLQKIVEEQGFTSLSPTDRRTYLNLTLARNPREVEKLSKKGQRELWKQLSEANIPLRSAPRPEDNQWGSDKNGRDIGDYSLEEYAAYKKKNFRLRELELESRIFKDHRKWASLGTKNSLTGEGYTVSQDDVEAEKHRRQEMAFLNEELYGTRTETVAQDPDWDDVVPIPQAEPEGALASIAYPEDYAEGTGWSSILLSWGNH